nr:unnamed protein product [Callosobruchus analis]
MIRAKLRLLGRFMLEMRKLDGKIRDLATLLSPEYFDNVMIAINHMAGFNSNTNTYRTPVTAVFEEDFGNYVNKTVTESQLQMKRQKKEIFSNILNIKEECYNLLREKFQIDLWKELASYTLISLLIFNRKRAGEAERITLNDFNTIQSACRISRKSKKIFEICYPRKKARGVSVLVSKEAFESIKLLVKFRQEANVAEENPYLFALPSNSPIHAHLDACKLLRLFAE